MPATEHHLLGLVRAELAVHPEVAPEPVFTWTEASRPGRERGLLRGAEGKRSQAWPYHLAGYIASVELGLGPTAAARLIGRDRSTLYNGVRRIEDRRDDPAFDSFIDRLAELARTTLAIRPMGLAA